MWVRLPPAAPEFDAVPTVECVADPPDVTACFDRRRIDGTYAYLLGMYLGDGMLTAAPRRVWRLRITLDARYPGILERCSLAMATVADRTIGRATKIGCVELYSNWKHWLCAFPQHGAGAKHRRQIELVEWQQQVVDAYPADFLTGLIHSDGCRSINRATPRGRLPLYEYPRYYFTNHSEAIRALFVDGCSKLGIECRPSNPFVISVARRESVRILDSFIGPKR
jgi:hypothetical protein